MEDVCPECQGTTWAKTIINGVVKYVRCRCYINARKDRLLKAARIPERYKKCSIGNFETHGLQSLISITDKIRRFVEFFPGDRRGLLLMGPPGVGKTHLAVGIIHYLIEDKNVHCLFYDFRELLNDIRHTYSKESDKTEESIVKPLLNCELLVLDELGAEKSSDWALDVLMYILNHRYNEMLPTIITTNYLDEPLDKSNKKDETLEERIGIRLRSRLYEMCETILIVGPDYRKQYMGKPQKKGIRRKLKRRLED